MMCSERTLSVTIFLEALVIFLESISVCFLGCIFLASTGRKHIRMKAIISHPNGNVFREAGV